MFSALSVTIIVALTIEQYIFIKFPVYSQVYCNRKKARKIIFILCFSVAFFRVPMYFFYDIFKTFNETISHNSASVISIIVVKKNFEDYQKFYFTLSFILFEIVPFMILSTLNFNLLYLLRKAIKDLEECNRNNLQLSETKKSLTNYRYESMVRLKDNSVNLDTPLMPKSSTVVFKKDPRLSALSAAKKKLLDYIMSLNEESL